MLCQYDPDCGTKQHYPQTVCPRTGLSGRDFASVELPPQLSTDGSPQRNSLRAGQSSQPKVGLTISAVALVLTLSLGSTQHHVIDMRLLAVGALLVMVPFGIAVGLLSHCNAWINDHTRRCRQPRAGFMYRCRHHQRQALTLYDLAGSIAFFIGSANLLLALRILLHADQINLVR